MTEGPTFCGMMAGGQQLSKAVRPIAQREIPAYAGMTWEGAGVTWESATFCGMTAGGRKLSKMVCPIAQGEIPAYARMTWEGAGVT